MARGTVRIKDESLMFVLGSDVEGAFTERRIQRGGQILGGEDKDDMFWIG